MDKESETENSLYSEIVRNLSSLMSDVKLEDDGSSKIDSSKCIGAKIHTQPNTSHVNQHSANAYLNQLQMLSLQNPQMQCLNMYAYIQQLTAINQLYLQQNQQQLNNSCYVWSGPISTETQEDAVYSRKVFLGGIPWAFNNVDIKKILSNYGSIKIEWPMDENNHKVKGFTHVIFESEEKVKMLLDTCKKNGTYIYKTNSYFHRIVSSEKHKMIEIIPWCINDACYINCSKQNLDASKTAFMGGIHGKLSADALAVIMNDLFGGVAFVGIDVDEHNYPKGAGRVIFNNQNSYMHAVAAKFIQIKSGKIQKKIQIDPFVQDSLCSSCGFQRGKFFCRDMLCFCYFCSQCWSIRHSMNINFQGHTPLTRSSNSQQQIACNDIKLDRIKNNSFKPLVMPNEVNKTSTNKRLGKKKSGCVHKNKKNN